jgi:hypothetical protein
LLEFGIGGAFPGRANAQAYLRSLQIRITANDGRHCEIWLVAGVMLEILARKLGKTIFGAATDFS